MADSDIHIKIIIDGNSKNVSLVRQEVNKLGNAINNVDTYANALKSTIGKMAAVGLGINGIAAAVTKSIGAVDNLLNATGRLKLVTSSMQELEDVSKRLLNVANETRVGFAGVVDIHARLAMSLERLHPSQEKMLEATKAINKSLIISGSSAQSAEAALIQLGQGLASDALRGQELMSVMEQTPRLAKAIAEGMGISIGQLRKVAEEGKLTAQTVFDAILSQKDKLAEEFAQMPKTFSQSIVVLGNNIQSILGKLNEDLGFTKTIGQISESLSNALTSLTPHIKEISSGIRILIEALIAYRLGAKLSKIQTAELAASMGRLPAIALLSSNALSAKTKALGLLSMGISGAKTALIALKNAFKTFLPAAVIFGAVEAFFALRDSMKEAKVSGDELNKILNLTNEELKKLTKNQLAFKDIELKDALDDKFKELDKFQKKLEEHNKFKDFSFFRLDDRELAKTKSEIDRIKAEIKQITDKRKEISKVNFDIEGTEAQIQKDNAQLDRLNKRLDELKGITTLDDLKEKAAALQKEIDGYQSKIPDTIEAQIKQERLVEKLKIQLDQTREKIANFNKKELKDLSNLNSAYLEVARVGMSEYDKKRSEIEEKYKRWLERGVDVKSAKRAREILYGELDEEIAKKKRDEEKKALEEQESAYQKYYENLGKLEEAWQIERKKFQKQYVEIEKKFGKEAAESYLEIQKKKYLEPFVKHSKAAFKDIKNSWADTVSSMQKTVEDGFFNFFIGKTKSLKTTLKDIGTNLMRDMISPYARALSQGISGSFGSFLGGGSNLASIASNLGLAKNNSGGWSGSVGGTPVELSSTGQILRGASALDKSTTGLLNSISSLKTAYDTFTTGFGGTIASPFYSAGGWLGKAGFAGSSQFMNGMGNGASIAMGGNGTTAVGGPYMYGTAAGGAMVGGAVGYGVGAGLDKAFGAQTYAPYTGAVAGAAVGGYAAIAGSLAAVPVWGWIAAAVVLAIGGMIGKSKITDWGYQVGQNLSLGLDKGLDGGINNWKEKTKKSWFSKSVSNQTSPIDEQTQKMLNQYARATGTLLKDWTGGNFNLPARTYNKRTLIDEGFGGALLAGVTGKKYDKALRFGGAEGELEKTYRYWMEQAKKDKKETYNLISEYVGKVNSSIKSLKFETLSSGLQRVKFANNEAVEALKTLNAGLGAIGGDIEHIGRDTAAQIEKAYREALKTDFSKETVQRYEALIEAYKKAKQAQDDYTKAVLSFTQQIAQTQAGFYSAHGIDSSFINYQAIYTKFRTLLGALDKDIGDGHKQGVLKNGSLGDINSWAKHFLSMSSSSLGEFLSNGNVELRKALIETLTQYKSQANSTGGHEHWTKSMADLETVNKQIAALKLAQEAKKNIELQKEQAQKQLDALKEQLSILNLQKGAVEKIGSIAKSIRDSVIDRTTSTINYRSALEQAKKAFASGDYGSRAFGNLSDAVSHQKRFYEDTAATYEDYRLAMLRMAGEVEAITNHVTLDTIDKSIKELEDRIKKAQKELVEKNETLNQTGQDQLSMLEQQRQALIESSQKQLERMSDLLGAGSPIVRYLKDMLEYLIKPETGKDGKPKPPGIPNYTTPDNINTGVNTANGAVVKSEMDKFINSTYLAVLGRSVEQSGLDYWRDQIEKGKTSKQDLAGALAASARAMTGSNDRADWIEWAKSKGYKPFADGGIVTRPTRALIGEAGYDEAVIPLDGRKLKIDAGDDFRALSKKTDTLEQTMSEVKDAVKELVRYVRGIITEDGQGIYAKEKK